MCVLTITGKAYLWHQIRCIVSVLFRIGSGLESPDVVDALVTSLLILNGLFYLDVLFDNSSNVCKSRYSGNC